MISLSWKATVTNYLGVWVDLKVILDVEVKIYLQIVKNGLSVEMLYRKEFNIYVY